MQTKIYKSPLKKLVVFFEKSRDSWKERAIKAEEELEKKTIELPKVKKNDKKKASFPPTTHFQ